MAWGQNDGTFLQPLPNKQKQTNKPENHQAGSSRRRTGFLSVKACSFLDFSSRKSFFGLSQVFILSHVIITVQILDSL